MKTRTLGLALGIMLPASALVCLPLRAEAPAIPPTISKVWPVGMQRGTTATFVIEGRSLQSAKALLFDAPGLSGVILGVTEQTEAIKHPKAGVDTAAAVPQGHKAEARIQVTASRDVEPGLHWFRVETPLGTSNLAVFDVGSLPEIEKLKPPEESPQWVELPATLVGTIVAPGDTDTYGFEGKAGQELVFQVTASQLGSRLRSLLFLSDVQGRVLAKVGEYNRALDAVLTYKLPADGKYSISVTDREHSGGPSYFYRLNAGPLPYITGVFPLGVRAGQSGDVSVNGVNLAGLRQAKVDPPKWADGWTTVPLRLKTPAGVSLNKIELAVGNEPEVLEAEPNDTPAQAQAIPVPATINGHIANGDKHTDEDYFRFPVKQGEHLTIEVAAGRLGSPLDSVIEVLDAQGRPIPQATIRCLSQTSTTLFDRDSRGQGFRLLSLTGLRENDYLMVGDELVQLARIPDQPDADVEVSGISGQRITYLGTSPSVHPIDTPVYKAEILPPNATFPPNGLPVFHLTYRNDDGGPGYGGDSRLVLTAPKDGQYLLHIRDVRGLEGPDFAYRLTVRNSTPDFMLMADPGNPNVPHDGDVPVTVSVNRIQGYEGPIAIEVKGLPKGVTASPATIPAGQDSTVVVLSASSAASLGSIARIQIEGHAQVSGRELVRVANSQKPLQVASVIPSPDLLIATDQREVSLTPGKEVTVRLHIQRKNGFQGRVPCRVINLPPGVRVVNVGLNGVLVHEGQDSQTFTLKAEDWAQPIEQLIYVMGTVESNSPTNHASIPLTLKVHGREVAATSGEAASTNR